MPRRRNAQPSSVAEPDENRLNNPPNHTFSGEEEESTLYTKQHTNPGFDADNSVLSKSVASTKPQISIVRALASEMSEVTPMAHGDSAFVKESRIPVNIQGEQLDLTPEQVELIKHTLREDSKKFDYNFYATKKTIAQGMMDISLLSANAFQLRAVLQGGDTAEFFGVLIAMIFISIFLQVVVALLLLFIGKTVVNEVEPVQRQKADKLNNAATGIIMIVTILNVMISAFGVSRPAIKAN